MKNKTTQKNRLLCVCCVVVCFLFVPGWIPVQARQANVLLPTVENSEKAALRIHFDFASEEDVNEGYKGTLMNGAKLIRMGEFPVLSLGKNDGYFDMSSMTGAVVSKLENFTVSTNIYIPSSTTLSGNGNFIWTFSNSNNSGSAKNGYAFMRANDTRYAITKTYYPSESELNWKTTFPQGTWKNLTLTQEDGKARIYVDGELKAEGTLNLALSDLGSTKYNFLGRSSYTGDLYLKNAYYNDFRIYDGALSQDSIKGLNRVLPLLNKELLRQEITTVMEGVELPSSVRENMVLPTVLGEGIQISWASSDEKVITSKGLVTRPAEGEAAVMVILTGTFEKGGIELTKEYEVKVESRISDAESVRKDLEELALGNLENVYQDIGLPYKTQEGSVITWKSSESAFLTDQGKVLQLAPTGSGKKTVILTATATKGDAKQTREFTVNIGEEEGYSSYLFAYFTGNSPLQEQIRFAVSMDGYNYIPLNNGNPVIASDTIALKEAVRDPHILRGEDGKTFYMVVTDMKSSEGWSSNDGLVLLKSTDLINWTHTAIDFPNTWPERFDRNALTQVWAPQTIYDPEAGKYMVYYSIGEKSGGHYKIYYSYANEDFTELTEPKVLYDHGANTIDGDIVYKDGLYHLFFKTEQNGNGIQKATATSLKGPWTPNNKDLQQTSVAVEGSGVFKLINSDTWILMYDCYTSGYYQFCSSTDLEHFTWACNSSTNGTFSPRHGTVIPITQEEAVRLASKWASSVLDNTPLGARNPRVRKDYLEIDKSAKTIYVPVEQGTDLANFDPQLYGFTGTAVTPGGEQDFTQGTINYTFSVRGIQTTYTVKAEVCGNPVIPAFHADPEVMYSKKTGRFYIYPTTDGYSGWGGYSFNVFSSPDLVHWTDEGTILDLSTDQVSWANGNAWAPCIEEKEVNGAYNYYFYFSGNTSKGKQIGVAVSNSPAGPFVDHGSPIVTSSPTGGGQQIDVDVFTDPVSGKSYLYWGNGYMAGAELNADMVSLKPGTTKVMTPSGGSLATYAYREAPYVFFRNGVYYFLWSVDDTGSPNYHVAYGTSTSPLGPISVAKNPVVLIQDAANKIYGPAHNSILQIPGRDEWYIVYHRINKNYLNNGPGYHREVCIDRLYFNTDGTIKQVVPTQKGIDPVSVDGSYTGIEEIPADQNRTVKRVVYYNVDGIVLGNDVESLPQGAYIRQNIYSDGSVESETFMKY